jgi:hypothetical protein
MIIGGVWTIRVLEPGLGGIGLTGEADVTDINARNGHTKVQITGAQRAVLDDLL